jgi:hypothetical protein
MEIKDMSERTLEELQALKNRLQHDIRRSQQMDSDGLSKHSPLMRNFESVKQEILKLKENK